MAINPVPAHYPGFIFDGENSRNYGVYITGVDIYGAPERDTELVTIPGRNGDYNLDRGRWKNTKITYECAMGADTEADFLTGIDAFRNMLASRIGYKRLEDEINTGEYRQAVFADGFDVDYIDPKAAAFSVVFECKPQRFLTAGETAQAVTSGGTVTNPTAYEAAPQLQVWGYGGIDINGQPLNIISTPIGQILLANGYVGHPTITESLNLAALNNGDTITINKAFTSLGGRPNASHWDFVSVVSSTFLHNDLSATKQVYINPNTDLASVQVETNQITLQKGTAYSGYATVEGVFSVSTNYDPAINVTVTNTLTVSYDGDSTIVMSVSYTVSEDWDVGNPGVIFNSIYGNSTQSALGSPIYFDLDIGEAWKEEGGGIVSVNNAVTIPAKLPTLSPGANTIPYDNTITQFKIVPRWWKL